MSYSPRHPLRLSSDSSWVLLELPDDMMERRCAKLARFNHGDAANVRLTSREALEVLRTQGLPLPQYAFPCAQAKV